MALGQPVKISEGLGENAGCPGCGSLQIQTFFASNDLPINCSALWPTSQSARDCARGRIDLTRCANCELIFNSTFDPFSLRYDERYENGLSSSPTFLKYRANLVRYLHDSYDLNGKSIVEIGCGAGHFLKALCETGKSFGIGYDPSLPEDVLSDERVRFIRDYYSEAHAPKEIDLICCRHVLEHMAQPLEFLSRLRSGLAQQRNVTLYFEVPNAEFVFAGMGLWDIIYPHVSYFSLRSFQTLFMRAGFEVIRSKSTYQGQFLSIEARVSAAYQAEAAMRPIEHASLLPGEAFARRYEEMVRLWSSYIRSAQLERKRLAFWGAGTKGVTFLNVVPGAGEIGCVVDVNPRKQGMHVPGTGQLISAPARLREYRPEAVVALNPAYVAEISAMLSGMRVSAEVIDDCAA